MKNRSQSNAESFHLNRCRELIHAKLGRARNATWKQRDFEALSELIFQETGILLSLSTLKRIWKSGYDSLPHPMTLNALSAFVGYKNWLDFKSAGTKAQNRSLLKPLVPRTGSQSARRSGVAGLFARFALATLILAAVGGISVLFWSGVGPRVVVSSSANQVVFSGRKLLPHGLPNTVVFDYDLSGIQADSVFINPSSEHVGTTRIDSERGQFSNVYYYPGLHQAQLLADGKVVRLYDVHITTAGWLGLVRYATSAGPPTYLPQRDIVRDGRLYVSPAALRARNIDTSRPDFWVGFSISRDFGTLTGDDFTLETRVKNNLYEGAATCQYVQIGVMCETGDLMLPLSAPGCVGNLTLETSGASVSGRDNDLSMFGCDLSLWNQIKWTVQNGASTVWLNGGPVYEFSVEEPLGRIVSLHFGFAGCGAVDVVELRDGSDRVFLKDDFGGSANQGMGAPRSFHLQK